MLSSAPTLDQGLILPAVFSSKPEYAEIKVLPESFRLNLRAAARNVKAVERLLGVKLPEKVGASFINDHQKVLCVSPDEWLLIDALSQRDTFLTSIKQIDQKPVFSYVDISHRNVALSIKGSHAVKLINLGCPLNLSLNHFPVGKCTRTIFENAEMTILRDSENAFHIEVWRSFAPYICGFFNRYMTSLY